MVMVEMGMMALLSLVDDKERTQTENVQTWSSVPIPGSGTTYSNK